MQLDKQNLIWIDLEMTGLDPEKERIIEIATIVTDKDLNILASSADLKKTEVSTSTTNSIVVKSSL